MFTVQLMQNSNTVTGRWALCLCYSLRNFVFDLKSFLLFHVLANTLYHPSHFSDLHSPIFTILFEISIRSIRWWLLFLGRKIERKLCWLSKFISSEAKQPGLPRPIGKFDITVWKSQWQTHDRKIGMAFWSVHGMMCLVDYTMHIAQYCVHLFSNLTCFRNERNETKRNEWKIFTLNSHYRQEVIYDWISVLWKVFFTWISAT